MEQVLTDSVLQDPLGRRIVLHDRTWYAHVIRGHPEVRAHRALAEEAVASPETIRSSSSDANCRKYVGRGPRSAVKMIVVADVAQEVVRTACLAKRVTGEIEWP